MLVGDLPLPPKLQEIYRESGIHELYPPQAECVRAGLFEGKNLLISIPTASGKTLVAEMAMHHHIVCGGKCLYVVPLKALASEKQNEFSGRGVRVGISTGDFDRRDDYLGKNDIIVATSEKVDSLIRNGSPWLKDITLLVIDEVHLIDDEGRGATLEMVIAKMRFRNPSMQLIGLSATIGNPDVLAGWLEATPVTSTWRPVDLRQGVYYQGKIHFHDNVRPVPSSSRYPDLDLCADTISEGGQCLVFVSSRRNAEGYAKRAATKFKVQDPELSSISLKIKETAETEQGNTLAACVAAGVAFHHAGLTRDERGLVEEGFRKGAIKCISSTPTLAAGLNLPARRVIIRDYLRFSSGEGMVPIPVREYHQMAGRAGRPRLDPYGEAVLIAKEERDIDSLFEWYIDAPAEDVYSRCSGESVLCTHILSLIASGFVKSRESLEKFMERTFYMYQRKKSLTIHRTIDQILLFLVSTEMITDLGDCLSPTEYGTLVSQLYLDPGSAEKILDTMRTAASYSDMGLTQTICSTPDMYTLYVSNKDQHYLDRFWSDHAEELWEPLPEEPDEACYRGLKTMMVLCDWSDEVPDAMICERYSIGPGDIYNLVEGVNWLLHASGRLAGMFTPQYARAVRELEYRMKYGVKRELLPLVRLRQIGRVRARRLFNNGITSPDELRAAGKDKVAVILGRGITDLIFRSFPAVDGDGPESNSSVSQRTLAHYG
ncbi:MAG: ATP-dependent DNA helicase [Methanoregulaceae archaeon]|nr:ATP-dependent DNA helicase [Methanoregulaceae archaeon]